MGATQWQRRFCDGSLEEDLPMRGLRWAHGGGWSQLGVVAEARQAVRPGGGPAHAGAEVGLVGWFRGKRGTGRLQGTGVARAGRRTQQLASRPLAAPVSTPLLPLVCPAAPAANSSTATTSLSASATPGAAALLPCLPCPALPCPALPCRDPPGRASRSARGSPPHPPARPLHSSARASAVSTQSKLPTRTHSRAPPGCWESWR